MFKFRKRLTSQGITWEQLGFQFVIILIGVYLAISFERRVEERARIDEVHEMLGRVLDELRLDDAEILAVTEGSSEIPVALDSVLNARLIPNGEIMDQAVREAYGNFLDY